jgi:hypothetical protein
VLSSNIMYMQLDTNITGLYLQNGSQAFQFNQDFKQITCTTDRDLLVCVAMNWNSIRLYTFNERDNKLVGNSTMSDLYPFMFLFFIYSKDTL